MLSIAGQNFEISNILRQSVRVARISAILLGFVHVCGIAGLLYPPTRPLFEKATPFNLLLSATLLFSFHKDWNAYFFIFMFITMLSGFFIEVAGVHTALIFGSYEYGPTLGLKVWEVPLVIGINWLILVYCTGVICHKLSVNILTKTALAGLMMVLLDVLIEPVAIVHNYWQWKENEIPLQNYAGWYASSFLLLWIFYKMPFGKQNAFARYLYIIMISFFAVLNLLHSAWV